MLRTHMRTSHDEPPSCASASGIAGVCAPDDTCGLAASDVGVRVENIPRSRLESRRADALPTPESTGVATPSAAMTSASEEEVAVGRPREVFEACRMYVTSRSGACTVIIEPKQDRHATRMLGSVEEHLC